MQRAKKSKSLTPPANTAGQAEPRRQGPVPLDPQQLSQVAGGSPKVGWYVRTDGKSPKGGW